MTIEIAGTLVESGVASVEAPLNFGDTLLEIVVTPEVGEPKTYAITANRGAGLLQRAYVKASNTDAFDSFGSSVALDGDTLVVGAGFEDSGATGVGGSELDNGTLSSGAVYVFRRTDAGWSQEAYIKASNPDANDTFGSSVALDGDTLAVGAAGEDSASTGVGGSESDNTAGQSGAVYVFRRSGTSWSQEAYLKASNTDASDEFGRHLALAGDTLAVGAVGERSAATGVGGNESDDSAISAGAVYVFERTSTSWSQQAYIKASNTAAGDAFGSDVAVSGDTLAVGAPGEDSAAKGVGGSESDNSAEDSGAVYVFQRAGTSWSQEAYVKASNADAGDRFGAAIALDDDTLVVGAPSEASAATGVGGNASDNSATSAGAVYVFRRSGESWSQEAYMKASNTDPGDRFGDDVALDGDILVVGASQEASATRGIDGDGANNSAIRAGAAYLFTREDSSWSPRSYIKASNADAEDRFGRGIAVDGGTLVVAADSEASAAKGINGNEADNSAMIAGAVFVFR